jgi:transposase
MALARPAPTCLYGLLVRAFRNLAALGGIIFVWRTGTPWRLLLQALGWGSGSTCWRGFRPGFRRLGIRHERRPDVLFGLLHLASALVCLRFLPE